jgi:ribosomal protein L40E
MRCIARAYSCRSCGWNGLSDELILLDRMRCQKCGSSDIRPGGASAEVDPQPQPGASVLLPSSARFGAASPT